MYEYLCGNCVDRIDISLTVHSRAILKIVKSTCNGIKKIKWTLMNNFESPNTITIVDVLRKNVLTYIFFRICVSNSLLLYSIWSLLWLSIKALVV
jgi:hypothetical protein